MVSMDNTALVEDEPMQNLYLALMQCFAIILCGYMAGRFNIIKKNDGNGLNTFIGTFALPSLIFMSLAKLDFQLVNWKFLLAILIAKGAVFFIVLLVSTAIIKPANPGRAALFAIFTTQSNDFAIGYPIISALYQKMHPDYVAYLYLMAPISLAILNPIGFILLEFGKQNREQRKNCKQTLYAVIKGVVLNPVLLMTLLGVLGNIIFHHSVPPILAVILELLGNAFTGSALFLLGIMMVGKVHRLKGTALVIPGILICIKLLVLPLVIRESIILLNVGQNATDTIALSTFGFLYGTIPTAPALFIFTLRYDLDIDLIASAMVACTFLSAPLMFVSARLINAINTGMKPVSYIKELNSFSLDISAASAAASIWLLLCFLGFDTKRYRSVVHKCTLYLIIAQLITAIGVLMWTKLDAKDVGSAVWYTQLILITFGVYASRMWTVGIAASLLFLSTRSLSFVMDLHRWMFPAGWGIPLILAMSMCVVSSTQKSSDTHVANPNFQLGTIQAAMSTFILTFCIIVTLGFLVLQQRYKHGRSSVSQSLTTTANCLSSPRNRGSIVDVEDLVSATANASLIECEYQSCLTDGCADETLVCDMNVGSHLNLHDSDALDPQTLRHLVLLILLLCSMFIGLSLSIGMLIMEEIAGIYAGLTFLDIAVTFGQSLIIFAIFGLDTELGHFLYKLLKSVCKWRTGEAHDNDGVQLPQEDALSPEVKAIREQFSQCHLAECRARIVMCHRRLLTVHRNVFSGTDLVDWLLQTKLVDNRDEAVRYGRCLLESRVLRHINDAHHFDDKDLLYMFNI